MVAPFHTTVSLSGYYFEDSIFTFNVSGGVTNADVGKAVTLDTTAANTVKLAGADEEVMGRLERVEERETGTVASVSLRFCGELPVATGETVNVGDAVIGAGSGEVKAAVSADRRQKVVEVLTDAVVVVQV